MAKIRKILLTFGIHIIRGLFKGLGLFGQGLKKVISPAIHVTKRVGWFLLFPIYKTLIFVNRRIFNAAYPAQNRLFAILNQKYITHVVIIFIALFVIGGNIMASETRRDNFGEKTIVYYLFKDQNIDDQQLVIERAITNPSERLKSASEKALEFGLSKNDAGSFTEQELSDSLSATTEGGLALVKPNISGSNFTSTAPRLSTIKHVVSEGETISSIAKKYNVSINTLLWENNLSERSVLKLGMELSILPVTGVNHKVVSGESIKAIAKKYGIDESTILTYNNLTVNDKLQIGQRLIIPGGEKRITAIASTKKSNSTSVAPLKQFIDPTVKGKAGGSGSMLWPTSWRVITQYYSWRHTGLDIDGDYNSPIYAADDGVVIRAGWGTGYGMMYIVDHGGGVQTVYAHLSKQYAKVGDTVSRGDTLGMMGSTGWSTGTHIHFEVRVNGKKMNPLSYIK